jgi:hypothetical protein
MSRLARAGPTEQRKEFVQRVKTLLGRKPAKLGDSRNDKEGANIRRSYSEHAGSAR